jgi:septal ring factor EnvC (AmiA/AmiB activator)
MVIGTLIIASAAVFFSVLGLTQTFSETALFWGTSIETAKLVLASFLYRFWDQINLIAKIITMAFIGALMTITSLGIYGHIITSYQEGNLQVENQNIRVETAQQKLDRIKQRIENVNNQLETKQSRVDAIQQDIARVPDNYVTVRRELIQERKPEMDRLENEINTLYEDRENLYDELGTQQEIVADLKIETGDIENKVGPIMFVIEQLGGAGERAVLWFVLLIVLVFDPVAIALTVYTNKVSLSLRDKKSVNQEESELNNNSQPEDISSSNTNEETSNDMSNVMSQVVNHLKKNEKTLEDHGKGLEEMKKHFDRERTKDDMIKDATR